MCRIDAIAQPHEIARINGKFTKKGLNLRIGVIGFSPEVVRHVIIEHLKRLEAENKNDSSFHRPNKLKVADGTEYFILYSSAQLRGIRLDQLMIADDSRWLIYNTQHELIKAAKDRLSLTSRIPEELRIIELELFRAI